MLSAAISELAPRRLVITECGDHRIAKMIAKCARSHDLTLQIRPDRHFYCSLETFNDWADGRDSLLLEHFYRRMRRAENVLMDGGEPEGGQWNFDKDNRESSGSDGPTDLPHVRRFRPDDITRDVTDLVESRFGDHPDQTATFDLSVTHDEARAALRDYIDNRLPSFGAYQDALRIDTRFAYHSRPSAALNLHLIDPRDCVDAAVAAYRAGKVPLNGVEGPALQLADPAWLHGAHCTLSCAKWPLARRRME